MANHLKMAQVHAIQVLRTRGWSFRRIARELGVHRDTVARYVRLAEAGAEPSNLPTGCADQNRPNLPAGADLDPVDQGAGGQNRPDPPAGPVLDAPCQGYSGPLSRCEPFRRAIIEGLDQGLSAQRIWQDLRVGHGFEGGYDSVKRFVRRLRSTRPLPFRRMECQPGEEAQIDFGSGAPVVKPDGKRKRTHVFRIVLSHSRKAYSEAVYRQTTDDFIRCIENALWHFGGVPKTLVVDNLKAAVLKADWFDPDLNPKIQAFSEHYGAVILPTKPRTPRHKGKVERQVDYIQDNALKGKTFTSLQEQNAYLLDWERQVADTRIHGTTRRQVGQAFEEVERPALLSLPIQRFPFFDEAQRMVSRDAHVEVDKAFYSVPPEYLGRTVWVRWDARMVRVFDHRMQQVAVHLKGEPGRFRTRPEHIAPEKISGVERGARWLLRKARLVGPHTQAWSESMLQVRGIQGVRVLVGLVSLAGRHRPEALEQACEIAQTHGAYRLRIIRELLKRRAPKQEQFEFIDTHPIIRSLSDYGDLVRASLTKDVGAQDTWLEMATS